MELLQKAKQALDDLTSTIPSFSGIENEIWLSVTAGEAGFYLQINSNMDKQPISLHSTIKNCEEQSQIIDILCELVLVFSIFKPHYYYKVINIDVSSTKLLDTQNLQGVRFIAQSQPSVMLFSSDIYFASKIGPNDMLLVLKNYFSLPLSCIHQFDEKSCIKKHKLHTSVSIFSSPQKPMGFSSLIILIQLGCLVVTCLDQLNLYERFSELVDVISGEFSWTTYKETDKPSCYLSYRIEKKFKKCKFEHHQTLFLIIQVKSRGMKVFNKFLKKKEPMNQLKEQVVSQLHVFKNKFGCELFDEEKDYRTRKTLEQESQEVANLMLEIEGELTYKHVISYVTGLNCEYAEHQEDNADIRARKIMNSLMKIDS